MNRRLLGWSFLVALVLFILSTVSVYAGTVRQIPTVAIPTVTGTPVGAVATVRRDTDQEQINVRSGPSTNYDAIGILVAGQEVPALGRTAGGDWVQIAYPGVQGGVGWVYSPLVSIAGNIPVIEPPPTPTPNVTPTIDPTLAAQFVVDLPPTRLPTFTPPPPLNLPTFAPVESTSGTGGVPMGFVIVGLGVVGLFGTLISFLRGH